MVCQAKRKGIRPAWIGDTLWKKMCAYWATDAAKKKSETASNSRNSDRGGLGPFKHFAGQMSFLRIQQNMVTYMNNNIVNYKVSYLSVSSSFYYCRKQNK